MLLYFKMLRTYTNETDMIQALIDANGDPVTINIGETKEYLAEREEIIDEGIEMSVPPIGMQRIYNLYRNPETGKVEIEFTDSPRK